MFWPILWILGLLLILSAFVQWGVTMLGWKLWETGLGPTDWQRWSWPKKLALFPCCLPVSSQSCPGPCWELPITAIQQTKQEFTEALAKWDTLRRACRLKQPRACIWTRPCVASWESCPTSYINLFMHFPGMQRGPDIWWRSLNKFHEANYVNRHRTR